jgi:carboxyl-terminal processing protease
MLRLYVPQRLHEMRNEQRVRDGEKNLPPYNALADVWDTKLEGVNQSLLIRALNIANQAQVDGADMAKMLSGGLRALRVLATTPDIAAAFPGLADEAARNEFVAAIDDEDRKLEGRVGRAGYFDLTQTLSRITRANTSTVKIPETALLHEFGNGAMETLDEFSSIIWPDELKRFQKSTQGRFIGIGVQISLDEAMNLQVVTPLEGTPAQRAGLRRNDLIKEIDGESTLGISTQQAVDKITGERGDPVTLTVERKGVDEPLKFTIVRDVIPVYSVKGWKRSGAHETDWDYFVDAENKIGYVRLTQFTEETTRELREAVRQMRAAGGVSGLILDLRFNPGGLLSEAVSVSSLFVGDGVIVSQHDAAGLEREAQRAIPGAAVFDDIPVVVLVNEGSASASEIVSGCLQDYSKAVIVGARSFGKGSVQNVYPLASGAAALKLTTQYYHLPKGRLIHRRDGMTRWGVEPDVVVPMFPQQIADALELRQDADVLPIDDKGQPEPDAKTPDPDRLLTEGIDPQLETGLLLLRTQTLRTQDGHVMLSGKGGPVAGG